MKETRGRRAAKVRWSLAKLVPLALFWATVVRAEPVPAHIIGFAVTSRLPLLLRDRLPDGPRLAPRRPLLGMFFPERFTLGAMLGAIFLPSFDFQSQVGLPERASMLHSEWLTQVPGGFDAQPFERKAFDFQQRCQNTCRMGGWGTCVFENVVKQDDCDGIAGRTLISAVARRTPLVRDVLKLVGSRTTRLPTDLDQSFKLSARIVPGGVGFGVEAKW